MSKIADLTVEFMEIITYDDTSIIIEKLETLFSIMIIYDGYQKVINFIESVLPIINDEDIKQYVEKELEMYKMCVN